MFYRLKKSVKCLMGIDSESYLPTTHYYEVCYTDKNLFDGISAMVTGGNGAIGSAVCFELASKGAVVGMCGRSEKKISDAIQLIREKSSEIADRIVPVIMDVTNEESIQNGIKTYIDKYKKVDVFVNNAGGQPGKLTGNPEMLFSRDVEEIDTILNTNLRGTILCCKYISKYMINQNCGVIINMSSVAALGGIPCMSDYAASKSATIGLTKSLAIELAGNNIRVNCISPGLINQTLFDLGSPIWKSGANVLGRRGFTSDIAKTVSFLIDNTYITGQNIIVDGGRSIGLYGDRNE